MPFQETPEDAARPAVTLRSVTTTRFQLCDEFYFVDKAGTGHRVPPHTGGPPYDDSNSTDLATVPPILWGILASYGRQTLPALLHDHLCVHAKSLPANAGFRARSAADTLFRESLADEGVEWFRSWIFWAGVSFGRYASHAAGRLFLLIAHVVIAWVVLVATMLERSPPVAAVAFIVIVVGAALWRADWPLLPLGTFVGPIALAVGLLTFGAAGLLWIPDLLLWLARAIRALLGGASPGPFPVPKPTRTLW